jgi:hypothetical protein
MGAVRPSVGRRVYRNPLTYVIVGAVLVVATTAAPIALEFHRVSGISYNAKSPVNNGGQAIKAVRNARGGLLPSDPSSLRQSKAFNNDGYERADGGWGVKEWTKYGLIHGFSVEFEQIKPELEIDCEVYSCGAVDAHNCRTLGAINF